MKFRFVLLGPDDEPPPPAGRSTPPPASPPVGPTRHYEARDGGLLRREPLADGRWRSIPLTNFQARIVSDILRDDGQQQTREFGMEATLEGHTVSFAVTAAEFAGMGWVLPRLGPQAILYPGQQQHARAAIQCLSGDIRRQHVYAHLGWCQAGALRVYLHAGGGLSAEVNPDQWQVQVPAALQAYRLRLPTDGSAKVRAVRASLQLLQVAPDRISIPLLAAVYRAALGAVNFSVFLSGPSGVFKSALAALCQQHFGAALDARHLPAHFGSTASALEWLAFAAKDALLVVDDYAPTSGAGDGELHRIADVLFRTVGNQQGRQRLRGNGQLGVSRAPRALVLATGEVVPPGQSLRARLLILEVGAGEVNQGQLTACQGLAREGLMAGSMGAFVTWVSEHYEAIQARLGQRVEQLHSQDANRGRHARTPVAVAELEAGMELFLEFAVEVGALGADEQLELQHRTERALSELSVRQVGYQPSNDTSLRFLGLLQAALTAGRAHIADRRGQAPAQASRWGWQPSGSGRAWVARGRRIGWVTRTELFLDPQISYEVAREQAGQEGLPVSAQVLRQRLRQRGLLASVDVGRQMLLVRRTLAGQPRQVLHLRLTDLVGEAALIGP